MNDIINAPDPKKHSGIITVGYLLFGFGLFTAYFTGIIGLILIYLKRDDVRGTYLESHCNWLISTFWWGFFWNVLGWLTFWFGLGVVMWGVVWIWTAYKLLKGFLKIHAELSV